MIALPLVERFPFGDFIEFNLIRLAQVAKEKQIAVR